MSNKEAIKTKTSSTKKSNNATPTNSEFETFIKNQQNVVKRLKTELKSLINKVQLNDCGTAKKDKCIMELEQSINQREAEIHKLSNDLAELKEDNKKILLEFNSFKEKFYQLEIDYDRNLTLEKEEKGKLLEKLRKQEAMENQKIQELSFNYEELQQRLQDNVTELEEINKLYKETMQNFEQMQIDFQKQHCEFELYKKQVNEEMQKEQEKNKLEFEKLQEELKQKDEQFKQCLADKTLMEKEKNLIIDELNHKICRIERAFSQPTKMVQPMVTLPQAADNSDNSSTSETSNDNVAISNPQIRKPLENLSLQTLSNNENQKPEQNQTQRNYKFKRPVLPTTSSQQTNVSANISTNRKRRSQPVRQPTVIQNYNEFSLSSDDDDKDSNYNSFSQHIWRPNNECYVADTEASEGFAKAKRSKK